MPRSVTQKNPSAQQKFAALAEATARFLERTDEYPRATGHGLASEERRLGVWLERVRLRAAGGRAKAWQKAILSDVLPGWGSTDVDDWTTLLLLCAGDIYQSASHRRHDDALYMIRRSRYAFLNGNLHPDRIQALDNFLVDWEIDGEHDGNYERYFISEFAHFAAVYEQAGEPPLTDLEYASIRAQTFIDRQSRRFHEGSLSADHLESLECAAPSFRGYSGLTPRAHRVAL